MIHGSSGSGTTDLNLVSFRPETTDRRGRSVVTTHAAFRWVENTHDSDSAGPVSAPGEERRRACSFRHDQGEGFRRYDPQRTAGP